MRDKSIVYFFEIFSDYLKSSKKEKDIGKLFIILMYIYLDDYNNGNCSF